MSPVDRQGGDHDPFERTMPMPAPPPHRGTEDCPRCGGCGWLADGPELPQYDCPVCHGSGGVAAPDTACTCDHEESDGRSDVLRCLIHGPYGGYLRSALSLMPAPVDRQGGEARL